MTVTPSRSPLGAFVRSPLGVRGGGKIELYYTGNLAGIYSVGGKIWQAFQSYGIGNALPVNTSSGGSNWSRNILESHYVSGEGTKRWERTPICSGTDGSYCVAAVNSYAPALEFFHSTDLKTWTRTYYYSSSTALICFAWSQSASKFVALCSDGYVIYSSDGIIWTRQSSGKNLRNQYTTWSSHLNLFFTYFYNLFSGEEFSGSSADGLIWNEGPVHGAQIVSSDGSITVGINPRDDLLRYYTNSPSILIYSDGFGFLTSYTADDNLSFCCAGGGIMIAGYSAIGTYPSPNTTKIYYSSDGGSSWSSTTVIGFFVKGASVEFSNHCTFFGGKFYLSGVSAGYTTTIMTSKDGASWSALKPNKINFAGNL